MTNNKPSNEFYIKEAIKLAKKSLKYDDVPVGAIVVKDGVIIGRGYNKREKNGMSTHHAEIVAIESACKKLGGWYLHDCSIFVTLEPCPMCAGAIINSRIDNVIFGAYDQKNGCFGSKCNFNDIKFTHTPNIIGGILEEECASLLKDFFREKRLNNGKNN